MEMLAELVEGLDELTQRFARPILRWSGIGLAVYGVIKKEAVYVAGGATLIYSSKTVRKSLKEIEKH